MFLNNVSFCIGGTLWVVEWPIIKVYIHHTLCDSTILKFMLNYKIVISLDYNITQDTVSFKMIARCIPLVFISVCPITNIKNQVI